MDYERTEAGAIQRSISIEGTPHSLVLRAEDVRKERTGIHAKVTIGVDTMRVDGDTFNIGRREDRTRLANAAIKSPLVTELAPRFKDVLDHELLIFLEGLWEFEVGKNAPELRGGAEKRVAPPWLLRPYVLQKSGTILFGPPGRGKSWTAYMIAVAVDAGHQFFYDVVQGPTIIVNLERSAESVDARLADINVTLGLPRERPILRLDRRGRKFADVADAVGRVVEQEGAVLVVLDSLSRAGYGDLNANEDTNRGMDALNGLGTAWLAIGHTPRADESHLFGSQMQDAAADIMVGLMSEERIDTTGKITLGIGIKGTKANDVRRPPLTVMALEFDEIGLTTIRKARPAEFLTIENESAALDVRGQVAAYLEAEGQASATEISRDTGISRSTIATLLRHGQEFEGTRRGRSMVYSINTNMVLSDTTRPDDTSKGMVLSKHLSIDDNNNTSAANGVVEEVSRPVEDDTFPFDDEDSRLDSLASG